MEQFDSKREHHRVNLHSGDASLFYKFYAKNGKFLCDDVCKGKVINLSLGGALVRGVLPNLRLLRMLGDEELYIGCNFILDGNAVKILSRVRWANSNPKEGPLYHELGLHFIKVADDDKKFLEKFLISKQLKYGKQNRRADLLS